MKLIKIIFATLFATVALSACQQQDKSETTIGIIEPLEHKAMDEIVAGFTETMSKLYHKPVKIKVENSQNDANLERAIIQKMHDEGYNVILPIGTDATEMTLSIAKEQPVVSLASDMSDEARKKLNPCHVAIVHDEISPKQLLTFIHQVYPNIKEISLIHSSANKVFPEVEETVAAGKAVGITVKHVMISSLPELTSAVASLPTSTQAIFILKDHLIVSGVGTLAKAAESRHIPLITSDQGSVQDGAGFALGVHEREIGVEGAKLTAEILNGKSACDLPISEMTNLTVFVNKAAITRENQSLDTISQAAKQLGYKVEAE